MKYQLRPYQDQVVEKLVADIVNPAPVIAYLAQGAGKSLVIADLANRLNVDILVLSPSREITVQNSDKMRTYVPDEEIGIYSASLNSKVIKKYTFATIGSTYKKPEDFKHFKIVIIDECDLVNPRKTGSMFMSFLKKIGSPKVIGFTGTPYRLCQEYQKIRNGYILTHTMTKMINRIAPLFWKDIICNVTTQELIDAGYLVPNEYHFLSLTNWEDIPINKSKSDFDLARYSKAINSKLGVVTEVIAACEQKFDSVLVFCSSVDQAVELKELVPGSEVISAETKPKDRKKIVDGFKNGSIKIVFNYGVLTVGFDSPRLDCIILLRPTQSIRLYCQMLGRGSRISEGKTKCFVFDFTGTVKKLGRVETFKAEKTQYGWDVLSEKGYWHKKILYSFQIQK